MSTTVFHPDRSAPRWWRHEALLSRFIGDFVDAELRLMRRGGAGLPPRPWPPGLELEADLGVDSLERNALLVALTDCLHMQDGEAVQRLMDTLTFGDLCANLDVDGDEISFKTSGSSGVPKRCTHRLDALWQEACFFAEQFAQPRRILYAVPGHHIYGFLFTVLLPLASNVEEAALINVRKLLPSELMRQVEAGDVIIGYPEFWQAIAAQNARWPDGVMGVTSTAPCPPALARQLGDAGLRLLEIYGSSETAGVGWRSDPDQPYTLLPYWQRVPGGEPASVDQTSLVRFAPGGAQLDCQCQDKLEWRGARQFVPTGRLDEAVQVGGVNVYPAQVAALLRRHPGVRDAHVRLMRADEGTRLKAFVVPADRESAATLPEQLAVWARTQLAPAARPVSYTFGAALPASPQGKLADWIIDSAGQHGLDGGSAGF